MDPFIGEIRMFAGNFAPKGWAFCNGALLPISNNPALFSILGTTYGGNGTTTFALPNLQSRAPIGAENGGQSTGLSPVRLGEMSGRETVSLTTANLPNHTASVSVNVAIPASATSGNTGSTPSSATCFGPATAGGRAAELYSTNAPDVTLKPFVAEGTSSSVGADLPFEVRNPYLGMNYIIALQGVFPSHS